MADPAPDANGDTPIMFSLRRKRKPVTIEHEDGTLCNYVLVEMDGKQKDRWMNKNAKRFKYDAKTGKSLGMQDFTGLEASLIGECLYPEGADKRVPEDTIVPWPASTLAGLMEICQDLNGLGDKAQAQEKKD